MPILFTTFNFVILLSPSSVYAMKFAIHCYEAFAFFIFQKLITLYLGGPENAIKLMSSYPPKKIWAAFPLCCCWIFCYPCIPHTHLTMSTFRHLYLMVLQFVFLMPLLAFLEVIKGYSDNDEDFLQILSVIRLCSIVLCVYALFVYMRAASEPLLEYRVRGKFWAMKLAVIFASFVETAISFYKVRNFGEYYSRDVMTSAWAAAISCVCMLPLGVFVKRVFNVTDCDLSRPVHVSESLPNMESTLNIENHQYGSNFDTNKVEMEGNENNNWKMAIKNNKSQRMIDNIENNQTGANNSNSDSQLGSEIEIRKTSITFKRIAGDS